MEEVKEITLEVALSEAFDRLVHAKLEKQWHKVALVCLKFQC